MDKLKAWKVAAALLTLHCICVAIISAKYPSHPVLKYSFCDFAQIKSCKAAVFGSNSTFEFGNIASNTIYFNLLPNPMSLFLTCCAYEPLRWLIYFEFSPNYLAPKLRSSSARDVVKNGSATFYSYEIYFQFFVGGRIRCESYENSSRAAEVYITSSKFYFQQ